MGATMEEAKGEGQGETERGSEVFGNVINKETSTCFQRSKNSPYNCLDTTPSSFFSAFSSSFCLPGNSQRFIDM